MGISVNAVDARDPSERIIASVEHKSGTDGTIFVYMYGGSFMGGGDQLAGFFAVVSDGDISPVEATPHPFSDKSTGSGAHLVVRPGTSIPSLVFVDDDVLRVYTRDGFSS